MLSHRDYEEKELADLLATYQSGGIVVYGQIESLPGTYAKILVKSDGTVKVEGITTVSGSVDISDRWARQLGQVDIARYLGSTIGLSNPLHDQIVVSGAVIDPRNIRSLLSSDIVTAYGSQAQALLQRATTYDLIVQLRSAGAEIDPRSIRALLKTTDEIYSVLRTDAGVAYDARDRSWNLGASDIPDLSDRAARLLGRVYGSQGQQLLQRALTYESIVQLSHQGTEYDARQIRALTSADVVDISDKAARLLGIIYGSVGQLQQRAVSGDVYVQLRTAGVEYDARDIYGSQGQQILQRASTYDLIVQLRSAGVEIDPRQVLGSQTQLQQRATTYDLLVQLRHAGTEIDPRLIQDVQKVVTPSYLAPTALGAGGTATIKTAPGAGYKLRLKGIQISVDAATRIDLRWGTTAWRSYYLPANGSIERNFISENVEGGDNQALTLLSSAAANVTASASTETLAV